MNSAQMPVVAADELLRDGELYLWDEQVVSASKVNGLWHLLCIDKQTGRSLGVGYGLTLRGWFAMPTSEESMAPVLIPLSHFQPVRALQERLSLIPWHIYEQRDGEVFQAYLTPGTEDGWFLRRLDPDTFQPATEEPGVFYCYMKDSMGVWSRVLGGRTILPIYEGLDPADFQHIGDSSNIADLIERKRLSDMLGN